ncbi:hypothetical protein [Pseudoalteromonas byunsanensis]|uniref:hypothetical protein n=1 Tax=Pseudoalteromonas byunsanensis TaxID=327939 RepID=UPI001586702F|nr:hypothetical protein [Pseudoalteromonas byunsanensis]
MIGFAIEERKLSSGYERIKALLARNLRAGLYTKQNEPSVKDSRRLARKLFTTLFEII